MKPQRLKENFTIGIFSSSSPISATVPVRYARGVRYLESKGLRVVHGQLRGKADGYRSGTILRAPRNSTGSYTTRTFRC